MVGSDEGLSWTKRPRVGLEGVGGTDFRAEGSLELVEMEGEMGRLVEMLPSVDFEVDAEGAAVCGLEVANAVEYERMDCSESRGVYFSTLRWYLAWPVPSCPTGGVMAKRVLMSAQ